MGLAVTLSEYLSLRGTRLAASWVALPILLLLALAGFASAADAQAAGSEDGPASPGRVWLGPDGNPLPFKTDEEVMEFMRTAKVVSVREIGEGLTKPEVVMLEKEGIQMRAQFQSHNEKQDVVHLSTGTEMGFRDTYLFNIAAYKLGVMLGLDNIPPSVRRKVKGKWGSLTLWLEKTMTEKQRRARKIVNPGVLRWNLQMYRMWLFDELIANIDRNQGNILIDEGWNVWMIDHTRAFRRGNKLLRPERIRRFDRKLWDKIQALDEEEVKTRLKKWLRGSEIKAIFKRRDELAKYIQKLVDERGKAQIFYTLD
jgi:hypothetical protein